MIIHVNHIIHINHIIHVWPIVFSLSCGAFPAPSAWPGACCHAKKCDGGPKGEGCREELGKTFGWMHCTFFPGVSYCIFILWHLVGCWFSYPNQWIGLRFFSKAETPTNFMGKRGFHPWFPVVRCSLESSDLYWFGWLDYRFFPVLPGNPSI